MDYLVNRGYELNFLKTQIRRASDISRNDALKPKPKQQTDRHCSVRHYLYNPALPNISRIIHKHSNVLHSSGRCKNVCTNLPLVAYRRCKNISDILVRAKLPEPTNTDQPRSPYFDLLEDNDDYHIKWIDHVNSDDSGFEHIEMKVSRFTAVPDNRTTLFTITTYLTTGVVMCQGISFELWCSNEFPRLKEKNRTLLLSIPWFGSNV